MNEGNRTINILGVDISTTSYADVVNAVEGWLDRATVISASEARYVCVTSVHGIVTARSDPDLHPP